MPAIRMITAWPVATMMSGAVTFVKVRKGGDNSAATRMRSAVNAQIGTVALRLCRVDPLIQRLRSRLLPIRVGGQTHNLFFRCLFPRHAAGYAAFVHHVDEIRQAKELQEVGGDQ